MHLVSIATLRSASGLTVPLALALLALVAVPARAANQAVSISGLAFAPAAVNVTVDDTVTSNNEAGGVAHTVSSDTAGVFDSGNLNGGQTFSRTFTAAGTFAYHCNIHTSMTGTVIVAAGAATTPSPGAPSAPPAVGTGLAGDEQSPTLAIAIVLGAMAIGFGAVGTVVVVARRK